jgi:hypothetical protein
MDEPRESKSTPATGSQAPPPQTELNDVADAAIAWYMTDEFEKHLDRCFGEAKREAIDAHERFLKSQSANSGRETGS